jgi:hypothetical protein
MYVEKGLGIFFYCEELTPKFCADPLDTTCIVKKSAIGRL